MMLTENSQVDLPSGNVKVYRRRKHETEMQCLGRGQQEVGEKA